MILRSKTPHTDRYGVLIFGSEEKGLQRDTQNFCHSQQFTVRNLAVLALDVGQGRLVDVDAAHLKLSQ